MNNTTPNKSPAIAPFPYSVTLADGTIERFVIKPLPITKLYQWLYLAKDQSEPAMVALACEKTIDWIDMMDVDQFAKLAGKCSEIIFPQALRLAKGAPAAAALIAPVLQKTELGLKVIAILLNGFGEPSTKPQDSASVPATTSESPTPTVLTDCVKSSPPDREVLQSAS